jgi:hypothetical protein
MGYICAPWKTAALQRVGELAPDPLTVKTAHRLISQIAEWDLFPEPAISVKGSDLLIRFEHQHCGLARMLLFFVNGERVRYELLETDQLGDRLSELMENFL